MIYGLTEIARATGWDRRTLSVWVARGKMPPPTQRLASGPIWDAAVIDPWIKSHLAPDRATREVRTNGEDPAQRHGPKTAP